MTARCAPAAFVMGPKMLKQVLTPSFCRMGATNLMAGWFTGANIKATLQSSTHLTTCAGLRSTFTPSASKTSADPHLDETDRFPAFATVQPQAALRTTDAVLMLIVSAPSPPVPTISNSFLSPKSTELHAVFIALTIPAISDGVSPRARNNVRSDPTWTSSAPDKISPNAASVSSDVRDLSPPIRVSIYGFSVADVFVLLLLLLLLLIILFVLFFTIFGELKAWIGEGESNTERVAMRENRTMI
mmetsp:Transcript_39935/g.56280  ORF Transcript_39935/g.56280 Transcript_39935/m.56280 type:complete len:244 (-) Transcript_39935:26-757(-)